MVNIDGLDKADVLSALYNRSWPLGLGFMHYDKTPMEKEDAVKILEKYTYFDYLKGRVMKVDLKDDSEFMEALYDRDNGKGAAQAAINELRGIGSDDAATIHKQGMKESTAMAHNRLEQETRSTTEGGTKVVTLGFADVKDKLKPAIQRAVSELEE